MLVVAGLIRGAFEFQGQKCSAASRAYIADTIWSEVKEKLVSQKSLLLKWEAQKISETSLTQ